MNDMEGSGTEEDPYKIERFEQLQDVRQKLDAYYKLVSDIDATHTAEQEFEPIGGDENPFTGTFDGNNYEIRNLSIKQPEQDFIGLFGCIGDEGRVKSLGLTDSSIEGSYLVGGLVGRSHRGRVESSHAVNVDVSGEKYVGGLVGSNDGDRVESSYTIDSNVSGHMEVGGLIGANRGEVESSYAVNVDVSGNAFVGGLVGWNLRKIESSYVHKRNISGNRDVGDLVGSQYTKAWLENSFVLSESDNPSSSEGVDLVISRGNYKILYTVGAKTLYLQVNGEIYSHGKISPNQVQYLVDDEGLVEIKDRFRASLLATSGT